MLLLAEPSVWVQLVLAGLATWRLSVLIMRERGPGDILWWVRGRLGVTHDLSGEPYAWEGIGTLLSCLACTSVWVAVVCLLLPWQVNGILGGSAVALWLEALMSRSHDG